VGWFRECFLLVALRFRLEYIGLCICLQLRCQQSKDVDDGIEDPIPLILSVIKSLYALRGGVVSIYTSLGMRIVVVNSSVCLLFR